MRLSKEAIKQLDMLGDWVLLLKQEAFDGAQKVGSLYIPDSVNTNIRESKVGIVVAAGRGTTDDKNRLRACDVEIGRYAYYTRYGKQSVEGVDGERYILTRNRGVLAYLTLSEGQIIGIEPRHDRLLLEEIIVGEQATDSGLILLSDEQRGLDRDRYRRWNVLEVGPGQPKKYKDRIDIADRIPTETKVGDIVYASIDSGVRISWYEKDKEIVRRLIPESECIMREYALQDSVTC